MQLILLWAVCLLPGCLALPLPPDTAEVSQAQWKQAEDYLKKFYPDDFKTKEASSLVAKLKEMQNFFGLPITGKLNPLIMKIIRKPRCGLPDVSDYSLFPKTLKWRSSDITYRIVSYTPDLPKRTVDKIVAEAFSMWREHIPLNFRRVRAGFADIMISFETEDHGDGIPFDGPGNTIAHAFGPGPGIGGDVHFDNDEYWTESNVLGVNFLYAAVHELGHSLGLAHSSLPDAVMYPTYGYGKRDLKLGEDDIKGIQKLYGKRRTL